MISTSESLAVPRPKRRWLRIGVRGLMASILVLGCGLGYVVHEANVQRAAVVAVERTGGRVRYISISEPGIFDHPRAWAVVEWVGIDDFVSVRAVELMPGADDDDLAKVLRLRKLRFFYDHGANITDAMAARLGELPRLQAVTFGPGSKITDAALAGLARAPRLVQLDLRGIEGPLGDEHLAALAGSTQLESLSLPQATFTDAGLAHLGRLTSLRDLE